MVGVPRSKGCRICVQRRVRCDQTRPFCSNCKKGNRPCPGYGQDMKFQDEGPKLRQRYEKNPSSEADDEIQASALDPWLDVSSSSSSSSSAHASPGPQWDAVGLEVQRTQRQRIFGLLSIPGYNAVSGEGEEDQFGGAAAGTNLLSTGRLSFNDPFDMTTLNALIFSPDLEQKQLLHMFSSSLAPANQTQVIPEMRNHGRWLAHLPPRTGTSPLLDTAVRAVTLAHLGRQHGSERFFTESRPYYGKALRLLNAALLDEVKGMASETLCATILLSFYEMFASDSDESWVRHAGGAGTLMRIRGADRHRFGFDREIFLSYRHALIIEAFQQDTACFLDEPEWRELSRLIHEDLRSTGTVGDHLEVFDSAEDFYLEMASIPALTCDARNLRLLAKKIGDVKFAKADLMERTEMHRANLKGIFARFSAALRNLGHSPTSYVSGDPVIPVYYKYVNIFVGSSHVGYWSVLMVLNMVLRELDPNSLKASLYIMENREIALDCCRSEPYMETSSLLGPFFVIFALRLSLATLEPKQEREWVLRRLFHIGNTNMSIAKHVPGFEGQNSMPRVRESVKEVDRMEEALQETFE